MSYIIAFWIVVTLSAALAPVNSALGLYAKNLLMTATQFLNTLTGGHPDQSFSGRCGVNKQRNRGKGPWAYIANAIDRLFLLLKDQTNHCFNAIEHDRPSSVNYPKSLVSVFSFVCAAFAVHVLSMVINHI